MAEKQTQTNQTDDLNTENLEQETMSFNDRCGSPLSDQFEVPADVIADKDEYIDEP